MQKFISNYGIIKEPPFTIKFFLQIILSSIIFNPLNRLENSHYYILLAIFSLSLIKFNYTLFNKIIINKILFLLIYLFCAAYPLFFLLNNDVSLYFFMRRYVFYFLILSLLFAAVFSEDNIIDKNAPLLLIYILMLNLTAIFLIICGYSDVNVRIFSNESGLIRIITNGYIIIYSLIIYAYLKRNYYLLILALISLIFTFSRTGYIVLTLFLILIIFNDKRINKYSISIALAILIIIFFRSGLFEKLKFHNINYSTPSITLNSDTSSIHSSINDRSLDKITVQKVSKYFGERYSEPLNAIRNYSLNDFVFGVGFGKIINKDTKIENLTSKYDIHNSYISGLLYVGFTFIFFIWLLFLLIKKYFFINKKFTLFIIPVIIFESLSSQAIYFSSEGLIFFISYIVLSNWRVNNNESIR